MFPGAPGPNFTIRDLSSRGPLLADQPIRPVPSGNAARQSARAAHLARPAQVEALSKSHVQTTECLCFLSPLDAFGDDRGPGFLAESDQGRRECSASRVHVDIVDQRHVELDDVGIHPQNVAQAGVARTSIIDGQANATLSQVVELGQESVVAFNGLVLCQLAYDSIRVGENGGSEAGSTKVDGPTLTAM